MEGVRKRTGRSADSGGHAMRQGRVLRYGAP